LVNISETKSGKSVRLDMIHQEPTITRGGGGSSPSAELPVIQINPVSLYLRHAINSPASTVLP